MGLVARDLLTDDVLLVIFDSVSIIHRRRLSRVCKRWKRLIDITLSWVSVFSAVDDRRCVTDWQPSHWLGLRFISKRDYIRVPKTSASEILIQLAPRLPNLRAIDLECSDINTRILRNILNNCKKIQRLNLDSSTKLNYYSFNLMTKEWIHLRHINISCCTEVNELSASLLIRSLKHLESLNLCGTRITGKCLQHLNSNVKRLDISYCWGIQEEGLFALSRAKCTQLEELAINNFDFDGAESCLIALCNTFTALKHLQMSIGPCVAHDYFIDRLTVRGFSEIAKMTNLESLIIEKVCVMDNNALMKILNSCRKIKCLKLHLGWLNFCTDLAFERIDVLLPDLHELHISYPSAMTSKGMIGISKLKKLKSLSIINAGIDNEIFKVIEPLPHLVSINFDECRKITLRGLNHFCRIVNKRPSVKFEISLMGTGVTINRLRTKKNFPANLFGQISNFRATRHNYQLPPVIV